MLELACVALELAQVSHGGGCAQSQQHPIGNFVIQLSGICWWAAAAAGMHAWQHIIQGNHTVCMQARVIVGIVFTACLLSGPTLLLLITGRWLLC